MRHGQLIWNASKIPKFVLNLPHIQLIRDALISLSRQWTHQKMWQRLRDLFLHPTDFNQNSLVQIEHPETNPQQPFVLSDWPLYVTPPDLTRGPLADRGQDEEVVEDVETAVLGRPRPVRHRHEVVLDQRPRGRGQVVGAQTLDWHLQLAQHLRNYKGVRGKVRHKNCANELLRIVNRWCAKLLF